MNQHQLYYRKTLLVLSIALLIKVVVAYFLELGNDEAYYYTYALQPDYSHFDHPPLIGLLIQLFTFNLHWVSNISMRLGPIMCSVASALLIYKITARLYNPIAAFYAVLLYQCSIYTNIIAGLFTMPDAVQLPFYLGALYTMYNILFNVNSARSQSLYHWLLLGLLIGLASLSKVHGLYLWVGFGLYALLFDRKLFINYKLYVAVAVTTVCLIPIVYWNAHNQLASFAFHSARVTNHQLKWDCLLQEVVGEILYQNPILSIATLGFIGKSLLFKTIKHPFEQWLVCMGLPMIILFWGIALFNPTLPHWSGPGYIPLFILFAGSFNQQAQRVQRVTKIALGFILVLLPIALGIIHLYPCHFGNKQWEKLGEGCPTLDVSGWQQLSVQFDSVTTADARLEKKFAYAPILVDKWFPAAQLALYIGSKQPRHQLLGVGEVANLHKFAWLNEQRTWLKKGDYAYCIAPSNYTMNIEALKPYFQQIDKPDTLYQMRSGNVVRYFCIYRCRNCINIPPLPLQQYLK